MISYLGRSDWCVVRRFVLVQGAELKLRPIDDCLEAQINFGYTVSSYLKLQDVDYIAGLALKISEKVHGQQMGSDGKMSKHQGQILHDSMRYACGFFSGKFLHQVCVEALALSGNGSRAGPAEVTSFCDYAVQMLQSAKTLRIEVSFQKQPVLVFTDGSWESGFAGIGPAIIIDTATGQCWVCQGDTPSDLMQKWRISVGDHLICQIELYVMVLVRHQFCWLLHQRRSIWSVDNDAARFCTIIAFG